MPITFFGEQEASPNVEVIDGRTIGTWIGITDKGVRRRTEPVRAVILHHTAGRGKAPQVFKTLRTRRNKVGKLIGLGYHFVIEPDGRVVQMADVAHVVQHAGSANSYSVGIAMVNPGNPTPGWETYSDVVNGKIRACARFTQKQVDACKALCETLSDRLGLPRTFPCSKDGKVLRGLLDASTLKSWSGFLGHIHVDAGKWDPVPHIMQDISDAWYEERT